MKFHCKSEIVPVENYWIRMSAQFLNVCVGLGWKHVLGATEATISVKICQILMLKRINLEDKQFCMSIGGYICYIWHQLGVELQPKWFDWPLWRRRFRLSLDYLTLGLEVFGNKYWSQFVEDTIQFGRILGEQRPFGLQVECAGTNQIYFVTSALGVEKETYGSSIVSSGYDSLVVSSALVSMCVSGSITATSTSREVYVLMNISTPNAGIIPPKRLLSAKVGLTENRRSGKRNSQETMRLNQCQTGSEEN